MIRRAFGLRIPFLGLATAFKLCKLIGFDLDAHQIFRLGEFAEFDTGPGGGLHLIGHRPVL